MVERLLVAVIISDGAVFNMLTTMAIVVLRVVLNVGTRWNSGCCDCCSLWLLIQLLVYAAIAFGSPTSTPSKTQA